MGRRAEGRGRPVGWSTLPTVPTASPSRPCRANCEHLVRTRSLVEPTPQEAGTFPAAFEPVLQRLRHPLVAVGVTVLLTVPWIGTVLTFGGYGSVHPGENVSPGLALFVAGSAILGAAFLLAWAAETAEKDVPQAFAITVPAVLTVAPEYAVDVLYAWQAGLAPARQPTSPWPTRPARTGYSSASAGPPTPSSPSSARNTRPIRRSNTGRGSSGMSSDSTRGYPPR